ncbi:MAG: hypothetical protein DRQ61_11955 [Gammaproteobacteria bacterium]|nr:MAG: hypothetical protein DRQ61_11955 [Gammaproteobacteria bacterium]
MTQYGLKTTRPGMVIPLPDTDFSEERVLAYTDLMNAKHPIHVDEAYSKKTSFGRRIAHGPMAMAASLAPLGEIYGENLIAMLNVRGWSFLQAIFLGEVLKTEACVLDVDRGRGAVTLEIRIYNPNGQIAQRGEVGLLLRRD